MAIKFYGAINAVGGTTGALDAIDGAGLNDGDTAFVVLTSGQTFRFILDADSGLSEDATYYSVVSPDSNAGTKRWIRVWSGGRTVMGDSTIDQGDPNVVGSLAWHVTDIGANEDTITLLPGTHDIATNETVPANVTLKFMHGASISIDTGNTLSHAGPIQAPEGVQIISMDDADSFTYTGPTMLHSKWFGALHDGATNDSTALNNMIGACAEGGSVQIDQGLSRCNGVDFDVDRLHITFIGRLKPSANSTYVMRIGGAGTTEVTGVTAHDIDIDSGSDYITWDTVEGCVIQNLYSSSIHFRRVEGCAKGLHLTNPGAKGVVYNKFFLSHIVDNKINVHINPDNSGWVNENSFYGGRFHHNSGKASYVGTKNLQISDDDTNAPNSNVFYHPSFEGSGLVIADINGVNNHIFDCRIEMVGYTLGSIVFQSAASRNKFTTAYTDDLLANGISVSATDTVTDVSATQFTIDADWTDYIVKGTPLLIELDDATEHVAVAYASSFGGGNTTVRLVYEIQDYVATTNEVADVTVPPITNTGRGNEIDIRADYPLSSNLNHKILDERSEFREGGLFLKGIGSDIPALALAPGSSGNDHVLTVSDFAEYTCTLDANGKLQLYDDNAVAIELSAGTPFILMYDASGNEQVRLDGTDGSISFKTPSDGSGVTNESLFQRTSDGKICWKDSGGTINALY
jgi:hypothetical protein